MKTIGTFFAFLAFAAANAAFFYFAIPDSILGRAATWALEKTELIEVETSAPKNFSFRCRQPLPEFTLGIDSNPSNSELTKLCNCIWSELPEAAREFAVGLEDGKYGDSDESLMQLFVANFGSATQRCDAESY